MRKTAETPSRLTLVENRTRLWEGVLNSATKVMLAYCPPKDMLRELAASGDTTILVVHDRPWEFSVTPQAFGPGHEDDLVVKIENNDQKNPQMFALYTDPDFEFVCAIAYQIGDSQLPPTRMGPIPFYKQETNPSATPKDIS